MTTDAHHCSAGTNSRDKGPRCHAKLVELAKKRSDEARAKHLQSQFEKGNVCIGWGTSIRGTVDVDLKEGKKASEIVLIEGKEFISGELDCYDPRIIAYSNTLVHENAHAGQSYAPELPDDPTEDQKNAAKGKINACNEVARQQGLESDVLDDIVSIVDERLQKKRSA